MLSKAEWRQPISGQARPVPSQEVSRILKSGRLKDFGLTVFFDQKEAKAEMREPQAETIRTTVLRPGILTDEWLKKKEAEFRALVRSNRAPRNGRAAGVKVRKEIEQTALLSGIEKVRRVTGRVRPQLFLSIEFSEINEERVEVRLQLLC